MLAANKEHLELFIKGGIIGSLIGDAIGLGNDGIERKFASEINMCESKLNEPAGTWTSASAFSMATMQHLIEYNKLDVDQLMNNFYEVYIGGYLCLPNDNSGTETCKDISGITTESINNFTNGFPIDKCGLENTDGDVDCLLRCWPVCLFYCKNSLDELITNSHNICKITHNNITSQVYCSLFALLIRNIILQKKEKITELLIDFYNTKKMFDYSDEVKNIIKLKSTLPSNIDYIFWNSINTFSSQQSNFELCIKNGLFEKNDKNSLGILIGFLSGLNNNLNDIPIPWLKTVRLESEHMLIIQNFIDIILNNILEE